MENQMRIYSEGLSFPKDGAYDLRTLEVFVSNYRIILDRLVSVHLGRRQVPKDIKRRIAYKIQIKPGSIEFLINFIFEHKELIAIIAPDAAYGLAEKLAKMLRDAIELRKKASDLIKKGLTVNIRISNSFNIGSTINNSGVVFDDTSGSIVISDPIILWAAQLTRRPVNEILKKIDGQDVEYVDFNSLNSGIKLRPEDIDITGSHKEELDDNLTLIGKLDIVAFSYHKGTVIVNGERYNVQWNESIRTKIQKLADKDGILFKVRPIIDRKRLEAATEATAIGFHILDCDDPQKRIFD
jgi:hypothetical protein